MNPTALTILIAYSAVSILALVGILWIWKSTHSFDKDREDTVNTDTASPRVRRAGSSSP